MVESSGSKKYNKTGSKVIPSSRVNNFFKDLVNSCFSASTLDGEELIAPCKCRGTMRHVHRECLNQWRTASPRSDSFTRCEQCFASYTFNSTWITTLITHPGTIYTLYTILFVTWVVTSTFVSTGALSSSSFEENGDLFNLLPTLQISRGPFVSNLTLATILTGYNSFMQSSNRPFYGVIFVALTEYIFFTPSFILSFNTLFCIWRIQRYEIFFDKWLLVALAGFGVWRAGRSLHGMLEAAASRIVKLKLLEVLDRGESE